MTLFMKCPFRAYRKPLNSMSGVVLPVILVVMLIMTLATVALVRTTDSNMVIAGNIAFQRDLLNQADRVMPQVTQLFESGALATEAARQNDNADLQYYASIQAAAANGLPDALLNTPLTHASNINVDGMVIRYVIERMCTATGVADISRCVYSDDLGNKIGGNALNNTNVGSKLYPLYQISVWVVGPRVGETFVQSTVAI